MAHIVDLSVAFENGVKADPPGMGPSIEYVSHTDTFGRLQAFFPGLQSSDIARAEGWAIENVQLTTHNGTHVDAPRHYGSVMDDGSRALGIDELDLDWFFQPGVKLDFRDRPDGYVIVPEDIEKELDRIGHRIAPLEIVVINTRAGERFGHDDYVDAGCGVGRDATLHLVAKGVRVVGTDGWSWDAPFSHTARKFAETRDPSIIWEGHKAGLTSPYCQIEKLANLEVLPPVGFRISCFPCKVKGGSGGWTRAVAIFDH